MSFPNKLTELLQAHPKILSNITIVRFSAAFLNMSQEERKLKDQVIAVNSTYYQEYEYQVECYLIQEYQAEKDIKVTIHESKPLRKLAI